MTYLGIDVGGSSVKAASLVDGAVAWTGQSDRFANPTAADVSAAISQVVAGRAGDVAGIGLCVPGILDDAGASIALSVNLPRLNGVSLAGVVADALGRPAPRLRVLNDTTAAAYDLYLGRRLAGRLFLMVLGTGVGACVMDPAGPLRVDGDSPGHFGQMDVGQFGDPAGGRPPVVGPDGGAGSLEGYVGAPALAAAYGTDPDALARLRADDPAGWAIARAVRIAHAMYRPHHVILAGGVGVRLKHLLPDLRRAVDDRLTRIARDGWTFGVGDHDYHNAAGAARAAGIDHEGRGSSASPASVPT